MGNKIGLDQIKQLREETGAGIMEAKKALEEAKGEVKQAKELIKKWGVARVAKRGDKATDEGRVFVYQHHSGKVGAMVKLVCETDFVAKAEEFEKLGKELAMQVASMEPKTVAGLLKQAYIRDQKLLVKDLVDEVAGKVKEKIEIKEIARLSV